MPSTRVVLFTEAKTSREKALAYLIDHGSCTTLRAISEWGEHRLAARINELRDEGYLITSVIQQALNGKRYTQYEFQDHPLPCRRRVPMPRHLRRPLSQSIGLIG